jgi:hypothetical protein
MFSTVKTRIQVRHPRPIVASYFPRITHNIILQSPLWPCKWLPAGSPFKMFMDFLPPLIWAACPVHLTLLHLLGLSTGLCWTLAAFSFSWSFYTVGRTPWTGDQPVARPLLYTEQHRINAHRHRHPCLKWDSNPWSQCLSGRRQFMP